MHAATTGQNVTKTLRSIKHESFSVLPLFEVYMVSSQQGGEWSPLLIFWWGGGDCLDSEALIKLF